MTLAQPPATTSALPPRRPTGDPSPPLRDANGKAKCYNYFPYGHVSRDCPQPCRELACLKCNATGHAQRHCPVQPAGVPSTMLAAVSAAAVTVTPNSTPVQFVGDENVYSVRIYSKDVEVDGHPMAGFGDTGGSHCTIRVSGVLQCGFRFIDIPAERFSSFRSENEAFYLPIANHGATPKTLDRRTKIERSAPGSIPIVQRLTARSPVVRQDLDSGDNAEECEITDLVETLKEFRDTIEMSKSELGKTDATEVKIVKTPGSRPVQCKPYCASQKERNEFQELIREMKGNGIRSETNSSYASPSFVVRKTDSSPPLVIDNHRLNEQTECIHFIRRASRAHRAI